MQSDGRPERLNPGHPAYGMRCLAGGPERCDAPSEYRTLRPLHVGGRWRVVIYYECAAHALDGAS
jgi:hypothetical protein